MVKAVFPCRATEVQFGWFIPRGPPKPASVMGFALSDTAPFPGSSEHHGWNARKNFTKWWCRSRGKNFFFFLVQFCSFNPSPVPSTHQWLQKKHEAVWKTLLHESNSDFKTLLVSQQCICEKQLPKSTLLHYCWVIPSASLILLGKSHQYVPSPFATPLHALVDVHDESVFLTTSF